MTNSKKSNGANLGFENKLWEMADKMHGYRDRTGHTLFIEARRMGTLVSRVHRELSENNLETLGYGE